MEESRISKFLLYLNYALAATVYGMMAFGIGIVLYGYLFVPPPGG